MQAGGSLILSTRLKNGMTTDSTGEQPVSWWLDIYLRNESQRAEEFKIFTVNKSVTADGSLVSSMGGVKGMYPAPDIHEHFTIHKWLRHCVLPHAQHEQPGAHCEQLHGHHKAH